MPPFEVTNNTLLNRFEVHEDGRLAELGYKLGVSQITLVHTQVPPELEGRGIGSALVKAGIDYARQHDLKIVPHCPFARSYLQRHPEYNDLVVTE
jgi:predicted GNAT family acetyltransferase